MQYIVVIAKHSVSIHAPREGCDEGDTTISWYLYGVSIHAPREGCDHILTIYQLIRYSFNPRTPRGVRLGDARSICTK